MIILAFLGNRYGCLLSQIAPGEGVKFYLQISQNDMFFKFVSNIPKTVVF